MDNISETCCVDHKCTKEHNHLTVGESVFLVHKGSMLPWPCEESSTGHCVYNETEDPMHDNCLVCGEPEERK